MEIRDSGTSQTKISFIVATYNRADVLRHCVESFQHLASESALVFDVLVVNNNSRDHTADLLASYHFPWLGYINEPQAGVSYARNAGVAASQADYVVFIDDDAQITPDYLNYLKEVIAEEPDVFGGPIYPYYLVPKPDWFDDSFEVRLHHPDTGWIPQFSGSILSSSNMGFRRDYFLRIGGFDTNLGPKGEKFALGEDSEIIIRARKLGARMYYHTYLQVLHLVPGYKLNLLYHCYRAMEQGHSLAIHERLHSAQLPDPQTLLHHLYGTTKELQAQLRSDYQQLLGFDEIQANRYLMYKVFPRLRSLSYLQHQFEASQARRNWWQRVLHLNLYTLLNLWRYRATKA